MKRYILLLAFWALPLFGAHNLRIDGFPQLTLPIGTYFVISWETEQPSATIDYKVYLDINDNQQLDSADPLLGYSVLKEGSAWDLDETANSFYSMTEYQTFIGKYLLYVEDNGVADTAYLELIPFVPPTDFRIRGHVTPPLKGIAVMAMKLSMGRKFAPSCWNAISLVKQAGEPQPWGAFTQADGSFEIYLPTAMDSVFVMAIDFGDITDLVSQQNLLTPVNVDTIVEIDPIPLVEPTDTAYGIVMDDLNNPLGPYFHVMSMTINLFDMSMFWATTYNHADGTFQLPIVNLPTFGMYIFMVDNPFIPDYMTPAPLDTMAMGYPQFDSLQFIAYVADTVISGHVYMNGLPADNITVTGVNIQAGSNLTLSLSNGYYELRVSSKFPEYQVSVTPPETLVCEVQEGTQPAAPGDTGVDFHITCLSVEEHTAPYFSFDINPIATDRIELILTLCEISPVRFMLYDLTGRKLHELSYRSLAPGVYRMVWDIGELHSGIYFLRCVAGDRYITRKVVVLH